MLEDLEELRSQLLLIAALAFKCTVVLVCSIFRIWVLASVLVLFRRRPNGVEGGQLDGRFRFTLVRLYVHMRNAARLEVNGEAALVDVRCLLRAGAGQAAVKLVDLA